MVSNFNTPSSHVPAARSSSVDFATPITTPSPGATPDTFRSFEEKLKEKMAPPAKIKARPSVAPDEIGVENTKLPGAALPLTVSPVPVRPVPPQPETTEGSVIEFVSALQKEWGVQPDQLVAAFQSLSPDQLKESPEHALPLVLKKLNLTDEQGPRAQQLVAHLLEGLKAQGVVRNVKEMPPQQQLKFQALMKMDQATRALFLNEKNLPYSQDAGVDTQAIQSRIQSIAQKFDALNSQLSILTNADGEGEDQDDLSDESLESVQTARLPSQLASQLASQFGRRQTDVNENVSQKFGIPGQESRPLQPQGLNPQMLAVTQGLQVKDQQNELTDESNFDDLIVNPELKVQGAVFKSSADLHGLSTGNAKPVMNTAEALQSLNVKPATARSGDEGAGRNMFGGGKGSHGQSGSQSGANLSDAIAKNGENAAEAARLEGLQSNKSTFASTLNGTSAKADAATGALASQNSDVKNENLQQLAQQTQHALKKGGGEMVMKLTPEGMGQVHLKVAVQDGKVHVQMLADNVDAKKMLESQLGDLKKSLEVHNIRVDHMKIDVADQSQLGTSTDARREFSQQFQGHSRDARENLRHSMMESRRSRGYGEGTPALRETRAPARSNSSRLNLVA